MRAARMPPVVSISALENKGLDALWAKVGDFAKLTKASGEWNARRTGQQIRWMWAMVEDRLLSQFRADATVKKLVPELERAIAQGTMTPALAAERLLASARGEK